MHIVDWLVGEIRDREGVKLVDGRRIVGCSHCDLVKILGLDCSRKKVERAIKYLVEGGILEKSQPNLKHRGSTYYYTFVLDKYRRYVGCVEACGKFQENENRVANGCPALIDYI